MKVMGQRRIERKLAEAGLLDRRMQQRSLANKRERKRMMLINRGFEVLKKKLPFIEDQVHEKPSKKLRNQIGIPRTKRRLTKVDVLRLTIRYIEHLRSIVHGNRDAAIRTPSQMVEASKYELSKPLRTYHESKRSPWMGFKHSPTEKRLTNGSSTAGLRSVKALQLETSSSSLTKHDFPIRYMLTCSDLKARPYVGFQTMKDTKLWTPEVLRTN